MIIDTEEGAEFENDDVRLLLIKIILTWSW